MKDSPATRLPKPDFSPWLQRRIPFLCRSRDNPAYRAFRERRERNQWLGIDIPGWIARQRTSPAGCAVMLALASFLLIPLTLLSPFGSPRQVTLLGLLAVGALLIAIMWTQGKQGRRVPLRVSAAFNADSMNANLAMDLWMCGVNGREIAEALILENLERVVFSTVVLQVLGSGVLLLALLAPAPLPIQILYVLFILTMGALSFWIVIGSFPYSGHKNLILPVTARWRKSEDLWTRVRRELPRQLRELGFMFVTCLLLLLMIIVGMQALPAVVGRLPAGVPVWMWVQALGVFLAVAMVAGTAVLIRIFRPKETKRLEKMLEDANAAFEIFIRNEILKDPDARRTDAEIMGCVTRPEEAF